MIVRVKVRLGCLVLFQMFDKLLALPAGLYLQPHSAKRVVVLKVVTLAVNIKAQLIILLTYIVVKLVGRRIGRKIILFLAIIAVRHGVSNNVMVGQMSI